MRNVKAGKNNKPAIVAWEQFLKACADRTRLRLLHLLSKHSEICVLHLVDVLQTNQPKVSRHLAYLKRVGLVKDRKDGLRVYYSLALPPHLTFAKVLDCINTCCADLPEMHQDVRSLQQISELAIVVSQKKKGKIKMEPDLLTSQRPDNMPVELL